MKKLSPIILFVFITFFSCSNEEEKSTDLQVQSDPVKLELVAMSGQMRGSETTGEAMEWQEYFLLKNDMKFEKIQKRDGKEYRSSGTFEIVMLNGDKYLRFTHDTRNEAYGNCTGDTIELLRYTSSNELTGSWSACDGPGLEYAFN
ncbi:MULTISPECIES: hypothetical protein [unclassified Leeuwenhoekiella]|uniref:hypothetical protein n=1 Tax=unclassified Leeuwenhoekiella TaxID=2615029 RepID=UPI000C610418|nr:MULTISPECIES: hypothetical protein [unclassified Leeuwenhoekiella]MAW93841.1 hypothetical protein [Leeuwenhoekiella sp.]MBA82248.1 hypothetical protein [Leeuwenhoekiella sp.]|tara:strand:+ start:3217 stop:3654 length:438 start_codon:yes stop_codon:yes gene_type:complete